MLHCISAAKLPVQSGRKENTPSGFLVALLMVGAPLGVLLAVTFVTLAVMLPVSWLMGWL